jgi:hypothetical protein
MNLLTCAIKWDSIKALSVRATSVPCLHTTIGLNLTAHQTHFILYFTVSKVRIPACTFDRSTAIICGTPLAKLRYRSFDNSVKKIWILSPPNREIFVVLLDVLEIISRGLLLRSTSPELTSQPQNRSTNLPPRNSTRDIGSYDTAEIQNIPPAARNTSSLSWVGLEKSI